jgi:hypothetical protein
MPKKTANPFPGDYEPELDTTLTLNPELSSWYASLIGMLRWMVEIGRVDIITEVSKMASQMALPREGPNSHLRIPANQPQLSDGVQSIVPHHRHECFQT